MLSSSITSIKILSFRAGVPERHKGRGQLFQRALLIPTQWRSEKFSKGGEEPKLPHYFQAYFFHKTDLKLIETQERL